jgi:hypothetical protein
MIEKREREEAQLSVRLQRSCCDALCIVHNCTISTHPVVKPYIVQQEHTTRPVPCGANGRAKEMTMERTDC